MMRFRAGFFLFFLNLMLLYPLAHAWHMEVGEFRSLNTYDDPYFQRVEFQEAFDEPPLVFALITTWGSNPADIRIKTVTSTYFEASVVESVKEDGPHYDLTVHYVAIERGTHQLPDGTVIVADAVDTDAQQCQTAVFNCHPSWEQINLPAGLFADPPVVLAEIQTMNNEPGSPDPDPEGSLCVNAPANGKEPPKCSSTPWLTAAIDDIQATSFKVALERSESGYGTINTTERIAYLAVPRNVTGFFYLDLDNDALPDDPVSYVFQNSTGIKGWQNGGGVVTFLRPFEDAPLVIADKNTRYGGDGGWLRRAYNYLTAEKVKFVVDEDFDYDTERKHVAENVGLQAYSTGFHANFVQITGRISEDLLGLANPSDFVGREGVRVYAFLDDGNGEPDSNDFLVSKAQTDENGEYSLTVSACAGTTGCTYWVVVDSKSVTPAPRSGTAADTQGLWAEQTYGPVGALCSNPEGTLGTAEDPYRRTDSDGPGPCFGGRVGDRSDDLPAELQLGDRFPTDAEHVAAIKVVDSDVHTVDFAFSFNVVTNVNDQDDDPDSPRTCQGCLRQFIDNANGISGENHMRFVPAVSANVEGSGGYRWWSVKLASSSQTEGDYTYALPKLTDAGTTIDGSPYFYAVDNANDEAVEIPAVSVGVGGNGGTIGPLVAPVFEINVNDKGSGLTLEAENLTVQSVALFNSTPELNSSLILVRSSGSTNQDIVIRSNYLGSRADASDPGPAADGDPDAQGSQRGRAAITSLPGTQVHVYDNYVAYLFNSGVVLQGKALIERNLFEKIGFNEEAYDPFSNGTPYDEACGDAISFEQYEDAAAFSLGDVVARSNAIRHITAYGVETWHGPGAYRIEFNTIENTGEGILLDDGSRAYCGGEQGERGGIRLFGDGSLVQGNVIRSTGGNGVVVVARSDSDASTENRISVNEIYNNLGISIDLSQDSTALNGDGVSSNDGSLNNDEQNAGMDYPILTSARIQRGSDDELILDGYVGTPDGTTFDGKQVDIEVYIAGDDGNNNGEVLLNDGLEIPHGEGKTYVGRCTVTLGAHGAFHCEVAIPDSLTLEPGTWVTATATYPSSEAATVGNTSEFGPNRVVHELSPYAHVIVINEVLYEEVGRGSSSATNDEFIELFNAGEEPVSLEGWRIGDCDLVAGETESLNDSLEGILNPGEYAVIWIGSEGEGRDAAYASLQMYLNKSASLNNAGDDIQLFDNQNRLVDYVAYGRGRGLDPPPVLGVWDAANNDGLRGAEQGQSISLTPNGLDQDSSVCWELTGSGAAGTDCPGAPATIISDTYNGRKTSVGINNNGYRIRGFVYHDRSTNGAIDAGEDWSDGETVYVKLVQNDTVLKTVEVPSGSGRYEISAVAPGDYKVLVGNSDSADAQAAPPVDWVFVRPANGTHLVALGAEDLEGLNFGLFHGARIAGVLFDDTGLGDGVANNGEKEEEEPGLANALISVSDGSHTRSVRTNSEGRFELYVPYDWGRVQLQHRLRPATGYRSPTDSVANLAEDYDDAIAANSTVAHVDLGDASDLAGSVLSGYELGVARVSEFRSDQSSTVTTPGSVTYRHTFKPGTQGRVVLQRNGGEYRYLVRVDANCDGRFDPSVYTSDQEDADNRGVETWNTLDPGDSVTFWVLDPWPRTLDGSLRSCAVEVRVVVPAGEPEGAVDLATIQARLFWRNHEQVNEQVRVVESTVIRTVGGLKLEKLGCNVTSGSCDRDAYPTGYGSSVEGQPDDVLEYCIRYQNISTEAIRDVTLSDPIPFFTDIVGDAYEGTAEIYWRSGQAQRYLTQEDDSDAGKVADGVVEVRITQGTETLEPGQGGLVCYRVKIK